MSASPAGRLVGVRLTEVPEPVRFRALNNLLKTDGSLDGMLIASRSISERIALGVAAASPSDRVYWIPRDAWDCVMKPKARRRRRT